MKKNSNIILAVDPSGNFDEGRGTTGFAVMDSDTGKIVDAFSISAKDFNTCHDYWHSLVVRVITMSKLYHIDMVVLEGYVLYSHKAMGQVSSSLETPQVIGVLKYVMKQNNIPFIVQLACTVKNRWNNDVLSAKGILTKPGRFYLAGDNIRVNRHCIDAVRHAMHAYTYNKITKEALHGRRDSILQSNPRGIDRGSKQKSGVH